MADNKVKVRIFGQEYTISGERDASEIVEIAEYVDSKMKEIAHNFNAGGATATVPVLACVNIADEYFQHKHDIDGLKIKNKQLENEAANYMRMLEESKRNANQYKEGEARNSEDIVALKKEIEDLQAKCSEVESLYFDVQMENIRLKDQLSKLKD